MKAIVIKHPGGPEVLQLDEYPTPEPIGDEVLIEVRAAGLNRSDVFQRKGNYPAPPGVPADIPGLEAAGVVVQCGERVTKWKVGDQVCALLAGGGYAEFVNVREGQCLTVPKGLSFAEAASLPETVFTVWSNVFERGGLKRGENLLIHGGSSGIGITAIQIAHAMGAKVFVTVGSDEKGENCLKLGADVYVNYRKDDFEIVLKTDGVDVILDMVGGSYLQKNVNILRPEGRLVYINSVGGNQVDFDIRKIMSKRLTITGSMLRDREYAFKKRLAESVFEHVWPLVESGRFKPVIYRTFPFSEAREAHELLERSEHTGKIVLVR
jgi:putative PIG3 family NAD(P)H quinone oxidoreductase